MKNDVGRSPWFVLSLALFFLFSCASEQKKQTEVKDPRFYNNRGVANGKKGQYDQAISDFSKAIELSPAYQKAYNNRGTIFGRMGQYDRAIADFNKALEIDSMVAETYNNLAWLYATAKAPDFLNGKKAVELARKACDLSDWKDPNTLDTLAAAYARAGDFENAVKWQEKALEASDSARRSELQKRLNLYRERKPWPDG